MQNSSVSAATDGRGHGDKRIQMRDISELDSVGRRGMTGTGSVEERKANVTSQAPRALEGGEHCSSGFLPFMLPIFLPQNTPVLI